MQQDETTVESNEEQPTGAEVPHARSGVNRRPFTGGFEFDVTEEEKAVMADEAAAIEEDITKLNRQLKAQKESLGGQIKHKAKELAEIFEAVRLGKRTKVVECEEIFDFDQNEVRYELAGQVLRARPMEEQERQLQFKVEADLPEDAMATHSEDDDNNDTTEQMTFSEQRKQLDQRVEAVS